MGEAIHVLVVDDDRDGRDQLLTVLETLGYRPQAAASGEEALLRLNQERGPEAVLLDVRLPGIDGLEILRRYRLGGGRIPIVMISGIDRADTAATAIRLGATDYLTKPVDPDELRSVLERALGDFARPRPQALPQAMRPGQNPLGQSMAMRRVSELIERIADADVPVLLTGESGVGKDVVARELHARSTRADKVFVKINCAALPGELLESELFGHERGSFTGAARTKPGQFELADGGTLFLDEIGEMPVLLQAKLLQALQDGEFYRVGGQRKIRVDARVIVATNRDLERAIASGTFREDLYYRLNVVHLHIPPLRERREDIPQLIDHFIAKYGKRYGRTREDVPPHVVARFMSYDWPGNIRELENLVRRIMVLRDPRYVLAEMRDRPVAVPMAMPMSPTMPLAPAAGAPPSVPSMPWPPSLQQPAVDPNLLSGQSLSHAMDEVPELRIDLKEVGRRAAHVAEREAIITMLGHTGGNKREAASRLGISYKAILYKIREFGIGRPRPAKRPLAPLGPLASPLPTPHIPPTGPPTPPDDGPIQAAAPREARDEEEEALDDEAVVASEDAAEVETTEAGDELGEPKGPPEADLTEMLEDDERAEGASRPLIPSESEAGFPSG